MASINRNIQASHSKLLPTIPWEKPILAKPISMVGPALALNIEKPICHHFKERPPKNISAFDGFFFER